MRDCTVVGTCTGRAHGASVVLKAIELGQAAAVADFIPVQQRLANTEDAAEGVRAFVERRPAQFTGR